jgi:hypothetical protein
MLSSPSQDFAGSSRSTGPWAEHSSSVEEKDVVQILQGPGVQDLVGNGFTYRHDWGNHNGNVLPTLHWGAVNARSRVFVGISEGAPGGPDAGKFIGSARFTLYNVAPANGRVSFWAHIDWGHPIRLYADYLVINV